MKPNIFKVATKELSQDGFFTWLLQWADTKCREENYELHVLGRAFVNLLVNDEYKMQNRELTNIEAGRQWNNIDVWAKLYFQEGKGIFLILEDKVFAGRQSDQLLRYKAIAQKYCDEHNLELSCVFVKVGSEALREINTIASMGFKVVTRKQLLAFFSTAKSCHPLILDYKEYLESIESEHLTYYSAPVDNWNYRSWIGFYEYVDSNMSINTWHYVSNPSGGFWNLCMNWDYWHCFAIYSQIEQGDIKFKVALSDDETGLKTGDVDPNKVQRWLSDKLVKYAKNLGLSQLSAPYPFVRRGSYRAIGKIALTDWLVQDQTSVNLNNTLNALKKINAFHSSFVNYLRDGFKFDDIQ